MVAGRRLAQAELLLQVAAVQLAAGCVQRALRMSTRVRSPSACIVRAIESAWSGVSGAVRDRRLHNHEDIHSIDACIHEHRCYALRVQSKSTDGRRGRPRHRRPPTTIEGAACARSSSPGSHFCSPPSSWSPAIWTGDTLQWLFVAGGAVILSSRRPTRPRARGQRALDGLIALLALDHRAGVHLTAPISWWSFASGVALAALSTIGLIAHESNTERVVHELSVTSRDRTPTAVLPALGAPGGPAGGAPGAPPALVSPPPG